MKVAEFEHEGLKCLIQRLEELGHLCGYVGLPMDHEMAGTKKTWKLPSSARERDCTYDWAHENYEIEIHGDLTFSGEGDDYEGRSKDLYWYGFDCNHAWDQNDPKDEAYVRAECERLAEQLANPVKREESEDV